MQITLLQETGLAHIDYYRQQQVSTISPPNSRPRGSIAGVRGSIPGYCPLRTAPAHPPVHDNNVSREMCFF